MRGNNPPKNRTFEENIALKGRTENRHIGRHIEGRIVCDRAPKLRVRR